MSTLLRVEADTQTHRNIGAWILERLFWETNLKKDPITSYQPENVIMSLKKGTISKGDFIFLPMIFSDQLSNFGGGRRLLNFLGKTAKKGQMQYSNKERVFRKKLQRCVTTKWCQVDRGKGKGKSGYTPVN